MKHPVDSLRELSQTLTPSVRMPVLFVGHGNPMNAITENPFAAEWERIGAGLPEAQAIVVISAHWLSRGTFIQAVAQPDTIHDFLGFPPELFAVQYQAPGDPAIAQQLQHALLAYEAELDRTRGFDHGMWSVMMRMKPRHDIPMLQISLDVNQSLEQLLAMFAELKHLRNRGVIFIGSGNIVHNLGAIDWENGQPFDWAQEFDARLTDAMSEQRISIITRPEQLGMITQLAVPTDDHYRPMVAAMGLLDPDEQLSYFNTEIEMGSVGMRSFITL